MSEFIVSARKYRPATFDTVVGQLSITTTLKNSIANKHLGQAYLFCGPRGVGKTTCARIFAKTINCLNLTSDIEACNVCDSCKAFNESSSYNIHELDAASNNSVEDIRQLIEQVRIPPQIGKYSIYIIDEVHMLSSAAFNAFLKTLEEPPRHAIFILATTEKHKILPTILSRCQIFDFNRIKVEDAANHLMYVAEKEGITVEEEAMNVVALKADGAMRDALSIFDQIVSFCGSNITYADTIENLNILDYEYYFRLVEFFLAEDYVQSLMIFDEILDKGFDAHNFLNGLCSHFRDILVSKDAATVELLEVGAAIKERYKAQAQQCSVDFLLKALDLGNKFDLNYKASKNKRLHVELALLQFCSILKKKDDTVEVSNEGASKQSSSATHAKTESPQVHVPTSKKNPEVAKKPASISFKDMVAGKAVDTKPKEEVKKEETVPEVLDTTFTQDQLNNAWSEFVKRINSTKPRFAGVVVASEPVLKDGFVINYVVANENDAFTFKNEILKGLTDFLADKLKNNQITFNVGVSMGGAAGNVARPQTAQEKFEYLASKNPNLKKLKDDFDLELE